MFHSSPTHCITNCITISLACFFEEKQFDKMHFACHFLRPVAPELQLLAVLPAQSAPLLPAALRPLVEATFSSDQPDHK